MAKPARGLMLDDGRYLAGQQAVSVVWARFVCLFLTKMTGNTADTYVLVQVFKVNFGVKQ
jgi:hypothetical protein